MNVLSPRPGRATAALATLSLAIVGCSSGAGSTDPTSEVAASNAGAPTAEPDGPAATMADPGSAETPAEASPEATPEGAAGGGDTGPAAAPGEGRLVVNGTTYALTISECEFTTDGPTKGTVDIKGTEASGASFEMTQFYLGDEWSQTSVVLDLGPTKVYVQRSGAREGAVPAVVDGANVTWTESYRELDEAANSQVELGEGVLNLTCA